MTKMLDLLLSLYMPAVTPQAVLCLDVDVQLPVSLLIASSIWTSTGLKNPNWP